MDEKMLKETFKNTLNEYHNDVISKEIKEEVANSTSEMSEKLSKMDNSLEEFKNLLNTVNVNTYNWVDETVINSVATLFKGIAQNDVSKIKEAQEMMNSFDVQRTDDPELWGYLVPTQFIKKIEEVSYEFGIFAKYADRIQLSSNKAEQPSVYDLIDWYEFVGQNEEINKGKKEFSQIVYEVKKAGILIPLTWEVLKDTASNPKIFDYLVRAIWVARAYFLDKKGFRGNNSEGFVIKGLFALENANEYVLDGTSIKSFKPEDAFKIVNTLENRFLKGWSPRWFMSNYSKGILGTMKNENGGFYYPEIQMNNTLLGYPIETLDKDIFPAGQEDNPDTVMVAFGDLRNYTIADRDTMSLELWMAKDDFEKDRKSLRALERWDIVCRHEDAFVLVKTAEEES